MRFALFTLMSSSDYALFHPSPRPRSIHTHTNRHRHSHMDSGQSHPLDNRPPLRTNLKNQTCSWVSSPWNLSSSSLRELLAAFSCSASSRLCFKVSTHCCHTMKCFHLISRTSLRLLHSASQFVDEFERDSGEFDEEEIFSSS